MDFIQAKQSDTNAPRVLEKASATVLKAGQMCGLTSGLAVLGDASTTAVNTFYVIANAGVGETEVLVIDLADSVFEGTADANFAATNRNTLVDLVIAPAFLTTFTPGTTTPADWAAVTDGSFRISIDGTGYNLDAINFTGDTTMALVAATIQTVLQTATSGSDTVAWDATNEVFVISSVAATTSSSITVLSTSTGTVGTDVSGSAYLNGTAGNGVVTDYAQQIDLGASTTDVFEILPGIEAGTVGSATNVRFRLNK